MQRIIMPVSNKDYYAIMGLTRAATTAEVKKAFRKLARVHHPDVAKNKAAGEMMFKEINEAYEVLGNALSRRQYDSEPAHWRYGNPDAPRPRAPYTPAPDSSRRKDPSSRVNFAENEARVRGSGSGGAFRGSWDGAGDPYAGAGRSAFDSDPRNQMPAKWYIRGHASGTEGPFDFVELAALLRTGEMTGATKVRMDGESAWRPFQERHEFAWARDLPSETIYRHLNKKAFDFAESRPFTARKVKYFFGFVGGMVAYVFYYFIFGAGNTVTGGGLNYVAFKIFYYLIGGGDPQS